MEMSDLPPPPANLPRHPMHRRLGGPQGRAGPFGGDGNTMSLPWPPDQQTALLRIRKPYIAREIHFTPFHHISLTPRLTIIIPTERNNKTICQYTALYYSGAGEFPSAPCLAGRKKERKKERRKKNLMTARVSMLLKSPASLAFFRACFLPGRAKDLSAPRYSNLKSHTFSRHMLCTDGLFLCCVLY